MVNVGGRMKKFLKVKDVAEQLKVSPVTVRSYTNSGKLRHDFTPAGQRVFTQEYVDEFLGKSVKETRVFYIRSSNGDEVLMENQKNSLKEFYGDPVNIYKDKSSGLNDNRKGLASLMNDAKKGEFNTICITQKDRMARFGFKYLEAYFKSHNVKIIVMNDDDNKTMQEELMQDFMSLIASFSGKFYRLRGYEQQRKLLNKAGGVIDEKQKAN